VLDEPMAMLDPIARHDFMATVVRRGGRLPAD
jgi:energy-coupling factor transporter ATP-binding protein EcfA2